MRRKLPDERHAITHKFDIAGHEGYVTVGLFEDGMPGEIFLVMAKEGSTISGFADAFAQAISLRPPVRRAAAGPGRQVQPRPLRAVGHDEESRTSAFAKSIVDYIFRWLAAKFLSPEAQFRAGVNNRDEVVVSTPEQLPLQVAETAKAPQAARRSRRSRTRKTRRPCSTCGSIMVRSGACYKCTQLRHHQRLRVGSRDPHRGPDPLSPGNSDRADATASRQNPDRFSSALGEPCRVPAARLAAARRVGEDARRPDARCGAEDPVVAAMKLQAGQQIADIGAGTGLFEVPLAIAVGPTGRIYAEDIDAGFFPIIRKRAADAKLTNVETVLGGFTDPKLPVKNIDIVLIHDVMHHIEKRPDFIKTLTGYLAPSGRIVVVDYEAGRTHPDQPELQVSRQSLTGWMSDAGLTQVGDVKLFPDKHHDLRATADGEVVARLTLRRVSTPAARISAG